MIRNMIRKKIIKILIIGIAILLSGIFVFFIIPVPSNSLYPEFNSFIITDRNGITLREVLSKDYKTSVWKPLKEISFNMIKATIVKEDKRFFLHNGVDLISVLRAIYENLRYGKIESGGSTITMQVAKILLNYRRVNILKKLIEMIYALKLDLHLSKEQILEIYLNRAPYGNRTYGVEAAARFYFNKPAKDLSLDESCILAQIPRAPTPMNPLKNYSLIQKNKKNLLDKLLRYGLIDSFAYLCSKNEQNIVNRKEVLFKAPHFVDFLLNYKNKKLYSKITSTIDYNIQEKLEKMLFTLIKSLSKYNVKQGAVIVMDTKTGEILAMVGSKDYFDEYEGQVNGCISLRQPGSSLKPFLYILALQNGFPMSYLMNDTITEFKLADGTVFAPRNYGNKYHRFVRAREALASSFNVPAVHILERIGVENFYTFLKKLHFTSLYKKPNFYGLSLSLGAAEVKLIELVNGYRAIANKGLWSPYRIIRTEKTNRIGERIFSEETAYIITNVLSDNSSRIKAFGDDSPINLPFPCAVKTGTTKNFKDNWCIGFTKKYTLGVWIGNFDSSPMNGVSGISGAAPLFRDIMIELHRNEYPENFEEPGTLIHTMVCARTGMLPGKDCPVIEEIFIPGTEPKDTCIYCGGLVKSYKYPYISKMSSLVKGSDSVLSDINGFRILQPCNGDIFKLDPHIPVRNQGITIRIFADTSIESYSLYLNGKLLYKNNPNFLWQAKPGRYVLEAKAQVGSKLYEDKVIFTVY